MLNLLYLFISQLVLLNLKPYPYSQLGGIERLCLPTGETCRALDHIKNLLAEEILSSQLSIPFIIFSSIQNLTPTYL